MNEQEGFLVVGGDGVIGSALVRYLSNKGQKVFGTTRHLDHASSTRPFLDLSGDIATWRPPLKCNIAFLCAAVTNQEKCRQEPAGTQYVNVVRTLELAKSLLEAGFFVVFMSTNLVFDGAKPFPETTDVPNPKTEYGRQKALAEKSLQALGGQIAIMRLSKVFHGTMPLLQKWVGALRNSETIFPFDDLLCSPIPLDLVLGVLENVSRMRMSGIFHLSGDRDISYAEIALRLARHLKLDESLVSPRSARQANLVLEHLPAHTTLDVSGLTRKLGLAPPDVWATVNSAVASLIAHEENRSQ